MKRVVVIAVIMAVITSLFAFSVNATGTPIYTVRKSSYQTFNNVTYSVDVLQFKAASEGTSMLPGGMSQILYVEAYIQNTNDQAALCSLLQFQVNLDLNWTCSNLYSYGGDFMIGMNSLGFYLYPTTDFSFDDTKVIVPPNSTMYFVGAIELTANLDQTGQTIYQSTLDSVNLVNKPYSVTLGSYSYGSPVDLSSVITYIDGIELSLNNIDSNTDDIEGLLNDLVDAFTFAGSYIVPATSSVMNNTADYTDPDTGIRYYLRTTISPSYILSYDFETDSGNDVIYSGGTKRYVITSIGRIYTDSYYQFQSIGVPLPIVSDNTHRPYVVNFESNFLDAAYVYGSSTTMVSSIRSDRSSNRFIIPLGQNYFLIQYYLDVPIDYTVSINAITGNPISIANFAAYSGSNTYGFSLNNMINEIKMRIQDIWNAMSDRTTANESDELAGASDDNHTQEMEWYEDNQDAIEATGLSNYRFSQNQSGGILQVTTQFEQLWLALGDWTSLYIFILTLSLATFIIRHEPTTRVKQYRQSVAAERAERISYYGRKNAESRASHGSNSTMKSAIRRRNG